MTTETTKPTAWRPGNPIDSPVGEMIGVDPSAVPPNEIYKLMVGSIVPRPIAFVSTLSKAGVGNLAPFSFFNGICSKPPCLMISVTRKPTNEKKDTLRNIEETGEFVVNSSSEWLTDPLVHCAAAYPYGVDEMTEVGLTPIPSAKVRPPRVKQAAIHFECRLLKTVEIGDGTIGSGTAVFGEIVYVHIMKEAYDSGRIKVEALKPLARLGGSNYSLIGKVLDRKTPSLLTK